jgi:hypothetical protein
LPYKTIQYTSAGKSQLHIAELKFVFKQKKFNNNRMNGLLSAQNSNNGGSTDRWRAGFGGGFMSNGVANGGSTQNTSLMSNLAVRDTKSSTNMLRQFSAHNAAKRQQDRAKANIQKI